MKKIPVILSLIIVLFAGFSCKDEPVAAGFEDQEQMTIYDYIKANPDQYSDFMKILEKGGIDKTLSAYNPHGVGYTLFLPDNDAIEQFIEESDQFSSLDDLLNDAEYVNILSRYHAVNMSINSNDFPFGALPAQTLSDDYLTVSFVIETDTSYYKINNQAAVIRPNIELSNGLIHIIGSMLMPITYTTYDWLAQHPGYSIFKEAIDVTGLQGMFDINTKDEVTKPRPFTLLIEHDTIFSKGNVHSLQDLENMISPDNSNYSDPSNPLYNYVLYHMLTETHFLNDFLENSTNYTTYSEIPLNINGSGIDILVNKGKQVFDTLISVMGDTTYIDYVGIYYDYSNILTQSGVIHFIDQIMTQQKPSRAIQTFEFYEEPVLNEYRKEPDEYLIEDTASLNTIHWKGADLTFVEAGENIISAWGGDYLLIDGDFSISYTIPKLVQGNYTVLLGADSFNSRNALIQVYIDGKNIGGLIDLSTGGNSDAPFIQIELGTMNFQKYESHTIEVKSLIPGRFAWDYIRFEPLL
jgi:uncharacterized surface protein with fasciclin (FAS1) repeats